MGIGDFMTSLWLDRSQDRETSTADAPNAEVAVVGAGITGLVTAVLLARGGKRVAVSEARMPGAVTTGNSTAKVSLLQGTRLSSISRAVWRRGRAVRVPVVYAPGRGAGVE